jgi:phosphate transport system substrate-binding protein
VVITDAPGDTAWPVAGSTFILMQSTPVNVADSNAALKFFNWGYQHGKDMAKALLYVPMPDNVVGLIQKTWKENIKGAAF